MAQISISLVAMERPDIPNLGEMPSWLLICILQIAFQILLKRMGVIMSPVDFMEEHGNAPCVFGTHHEFSGCPSPWYATSAVAGVSGGIPAGAADPIDPPQPKSAPSSMSASVHQSASRGGTPNPMGPDTVLASSSTGLAPRTPPYPPPSASRGGKGGTRRFFGRIGDG